MSREIFDFRAYTRLKQLQHLLRTGQIDQQFFWTGMNGAGSLKTARTVFSYGVARSAV